MRRFFYLNFNKNDIYCLFPFWHLHWISGKSQYIAMFFLKRGKERGDNRCEKELKQIENGNKK